MKALDTNALVRFLVRDDEKQAREVFKILLEAEKSDAALFIALPVIQETLWVLASAYGYQKDSILKALEDILLMPVFEFEAQDRLTRLCRLAHTSEIDMADVLIGLTAKDAGCETTLTFDKKAGKSDLFTLIR